MRHSTFCFCLLLILLVPHSSLSATKTVTIDWTQSGTSEIVGYRMYYSYDSSMSNKMLACETSQTTFTSLTCADVNLEQSPVYFVVAAQTTTGEINSPVASGNWGTGMTLMGPLMLLLLNSRIETVPSI